MLRPIPQGGESRNSRSNEKKQQDDIERRRDLFRARRIVDNEVSDIERHRDDIGGGG